MRTSSDGFQYATAFPDVSMGYVGGNAGPEFFDTGPVYDPALYDALDLPGSRLGVLQPGLRPIDNTTRPTNPPMQQPQVAVGIQQQQKPKPFQCSHPGCNSKGFKRKYEFQRHTRKHSRSQTFPCPVAGCRFQQPSNAFYRHDKLVCHMKACHPGVPIPLANGPIAPAQVGTHGNMAASMAVTAHTVPTHNASQG
ncbi:hypothetical protein SLS54_008768 [Diplodia seriata]